MSGRSPPQFSPDMSLSGPVTSGGRACAVTVRVADRVEPAVVTLMVTVKARPLYRR